MDLRLLVWAPTTLYKSLARTGTALRQLLGTLVFTLEANTLA